MKTTETTRTTRKIEGIESVTDCKKVFWQNVAECLDYVKSSISDDGWRLDSSYNYTGEYGESDNGGKRWLDFCATIANDDSALSRTRYEVQADMQNLTVTLEITNDTDFGNLV